MRFPLSFIAFSVLFLGCLVPEVIAAELTVKVTNLRNGDGVVRFALYNDPKTFLETDGKLRKDHVRAAPDGVIFVYEGLEPGQYAVAVFHDEDHDDEFDQGTFGIPLEGYGFSRDAPVFFGEPPFKDAAIDLPDGGQEITIRMRY